VSEGKKVRMSEDRSQRTEVSLRPIGAYAPVGGQKSEDRGRKTRRSEDQRFRRSEVQKIRGLPVEVVPILKTKI